MIIGLRCAPDTPPALITLNPYVASPMFTPLRKMVNTAVVAIVLVVK